MCCLMGCCSGGDAEGIIRQKLIDKNYIDAVIGMPANLFTNTSIPVCVVVLRKNRELDAPIQIIDASKGFVKEDKTNTLFLEWSYMCL